MIDSPKPIEKENSNVLFFITLDEYSNEKLTV